MAADKTTIARPYAKAAFNYALSHNALEHWSQFLQAAAFVSSTPEVVAFLQEPSLTPEQHYDLFIDVCASVLDDKGRNFLHIMADNKRLPVLSEVACLYETLRAEHERMLDVQVTSFMPLTESQKDRIMVSLKHRLERDVVLQCIVDEKLLGGAIIRAGDFVIDGSVIGKLKKMRHTVTA